MTIEQLVTEYQNGNTDVSYELWEKLKGMIRKIAIKYPPEYFEDLMQESYFSLVKTLDVYEPKNCFSTIFYRITKTDFTRYVLKQGTRPEGIECVARKITRFEAEFCNINGRHPKDDEIKRALDITQIQLDAARSPRDTKSLDEPLTEDGFTIGDILPGSDDIESDYLQEEEKKILWEQVDKCNHPEILRQSFIDNKTIKEIAKDKGLTDAQVISRKQSDLRQLRNNNTIKELFAYNFKHVGCRQFQRTHTSEEETFILMMEEVGMLR